MSDCADLGCHDVDVVGRAQGIRDAYVMLLDEVKDGVEGGSVTVRDGQHLMSLVREIRGWLGGVEDALQ